MRLLLGFVFVVGLTNALTCPVKSIAKTGDGFAPVIHPTNQRIYNSYHHDPTGVIQCTSRVDGQRCPNYSAGTINLTPKGGASQPAFDNSNHGIHFVDPTELNDAAIYSAIQYHYYYVATFDPTDSSRIEWGIGCFDVQTDSNCASKSWLSLGPTSYPSLTVNSDASAAANLEMWNKKWWTFDAQLRLHCIDPATLNSCGAIDASTANFDQTSGGGRAPVNFRIDKSLGRFYLVRRLTNTNLKARCVTPVDTVGNDGIYDNLVECPGWPTVPAAGVTITPPSMGNNHVYWIFFRRKPDLSIDAICGDMHNGPHPWCVDVSDGSSIVGTNNGIPQSIHDYVYGSSSGVAGGGMTGSYYRYDTQTMTGYEFFAAYPVSQVFCYDWGAAAPCSTGNWVNGLISPPASVLPTENYMYDEDERGCMWALGDRQVLFTFDPVTGDLPCRRPIGNATTDTYAVGPSNSVTFNVLSNDYLPPGYTWDVTSVEYTLPATGTLDPPTITPGSPGSITFRYTAPIYSGQAFSASFTYSLCDSSLSPAPTTGTVNFEPYRWRIINPPQTGSGNEGMYLQEPIEIEFNVGEHDFKIELIDSSGNVVRTVGNYHAVTSPWTVYWKPYNVYPGIYKLRGTVSNATAPSADGPYGDSAEFKLWARKPAGL